MAPQSYTLVHRGGVYLEMPIMPLKRPFDRYASLAWTTSNCIIALEKLRQGKGLRPEENAALQKLAAEFNLLSESTKVTVDQISGEDNRSITPELLEGFFTLAEIEEASSAPISEAQLKQAGQDLEAIQRSATPAKDPTVVDRAQEACLLLLSRIDMLRPEVVTP